MRSLGPLESRQRFKSLTGQPLQEKRVVEYLFLDESGRSDPRSPGSFFALGGIAISDSEASDYRAKANDLKIEFFGRDDIMLHEPDVRTHRDWFSLGGDTRRQGAFCEALDELVAGVAFTSFGVAIRKDAFAEFVARGDDLYLPPDPYSVAIHMLLERYVDYLATRGDSALGRVTFESMGPREDAEHHRDYLELLLHGTQWVPDSTFRNWLATGCDFTRKQGSDPMELADMFSRDLFEWARGGCGAVTPRRWGVWQSKIYCRGDTVMGKFGIKVFPDSDIRDLIEEHRMQVSNRN